MHNIPRYFAMGVPIGSASPSIDCGSLALGSVTVCQFAGFLRRLSTANAICPSTGVHSWPPTICSFPLHHVGDRLDAASGVFRQAGAQRIAAVEGALAHEQLRGHEVSQNGCFAMFPLLVQHVVPDHNQDVDRRYGGFPLGWMLLQNRKQLAELDDLVDPKDVLLEPAGDCGVEPCQAWQLGKVRLRDQRDLTLELDEIRNGLFALLAQ